MNLRANEGSTAVRLMTALALIPVVLALIWTPGLERGFLLFITGLVFIGLREFFRMAAARGIEPCSWCATRLGTLLIPVTAVQAAAPVRVTDVFLLAVLALGALHVLSGRHTLAGFAVSVLGVAYVGLLPAHFVMLHGLPEGPGLVTLLLVAVALSDTGAYFAGKHLGRHKLAPRVSPNKTWEGAAGGVAAALPGMAVLYLLHTHAGVAFFPVRSLPAYLAVGAALAVIGQMGDLVESMLKRDAGVKDAGGLFPGHGGVLDRCDGFLFAGPALYYVAAAIIPFSRYV